MRNTLFTVPEVAAHLRVSVHAVLRLIDAGELAAVDIGAGELRVVPLHLRRFIRYRLRPRLVSQTGLLPVRTRAEARAPGTRVVPLHAVLDPPLPDPADVPEDDKDDGDAPSVNERP